MIRKAGKEERRINRRLCGELVEPWMLINADEEKNQFLAEYAKPAKERIINRWLTQIKKEGVPREFDKTYLQWRSCPFF